MTKHSQARTIHFVDFHSRAVLALFATLAALAAIFGFAAQGRAQSDDRIVQNYYDEQGEYAYEPAPDYVVETAPPALRTYSIPPAPYYGAVWVEPHWIWDGYRWVWVDGYYIAPRSGYVYVQPRWSVQWGVNVFVSGYFYPAHTHVVVWNSYDHYWWHRPSVYHHYFHNHRPYYYNDYRRGRYYYPQRSTSSRRGYDDRQRYGYDRGNDNRGRYDNRSTASNPSRNFAMGNDTRGAVRGGDRRGRYDSGSAGRGGSVDRGGVSSGRNGGGFSGGRPSAPSSGRGSSSGSSHGSTRGGRR